MRAIAHRLLLRLAVSAAKGRAGLPASSVNTRTRVAGSRSTGLRAAASAGLCSRNRCLEHRRRGAQHGQRPTGWQAGRQADPTDPSLPAARMGDDEMPSATRDVIDESDAQLASLIGRLTNVHVIDQRSVLTPSPRSRRARATTGSTRVTAREQASRRCRSTAGTCRSRWRRAGRLRPPIWRDSQFCVTDGGSRGGGVQPPPSTL